MNSSFKAGDIVQLKSGGPKMTVDQVATQAMSGVLSAWCTWFDKTAQKTGVFPLTSIELADSK